MRFAGEVYALPDTFTPKRKKNKTVCEENTLRFQRDEKIKKESMICICMHMYISIGMYMLYMYIKLCKKRKNVYVCAWVDADVCTHMCKYLYMCTHINKYMMHSPAKFDVWGSDNYKLIICMPMIGMTFKTSLRIAQKTPNSKRECIVSKYSRRHC